MSRLTVGHIFLLFQLESPVFGFSDKPPTRFDFAMAVFVCSHSWRKSRKHLQAWWLNWFFRFWGGVTLKKNDEVEQKRFADWVALERMALPVKQPGMLGGGEWRTLSAPMPYRLLALLMHMFHMAQDEALDQPLSHAECLYMSIAEWNGSAEFRDPRQDDLWEFAKQEDAKRYNDDGTRKEESLN